MSPRAVVIPFGVPSEGRGLGLGLAALVHSFAQIDGQNVALAQLMAKAKESGSDADPHPNAPRSADSVGRPSGAPSPVEAFVPPQAWRDLAGSGNAPGDVGVVVTGAFDPPNEGRGMIQLLAFDAKDGSTRAKVEAHIDGTYAGQMIFAAFDELWTRVGGGELGIVRDIGDLGWDALESVLRAERCALHDPLRGGPHDRLAALLHLGRAVGDAPDARFPAGRLAAMALDLATSPMSTSSLARAALRALTRASEDAPGQVDLLEATAAVHVRAGNAAEAEARANDALLQAPERTRLYALLSEARRAGGNLEGAMEACERGLERASNDGLLWTERGVIFAERGQLVEAEAAWRAVLAREPLHAPAFGNLATMVLKRGDSGTAQELVDQVLVARNVHPDVLRRALQLALATENDGVARAARLSALARALLERSPNDAWAGIVLARALAQTGDKNAAIGELARVEALVPESAIAAEAQRGRFALTDPHAATELEAVLRAAYAAPPADLEAIASRARRLTTLHAVWSSWFALGVAERRRERWPAAREAFEAAIRACAGCTPANIELVAVCVSLGDPDAALRHAERAVILEGETPRTLAIRATALLAGERYDEAETAIDRALALDGTDEANRALSERIRAGATSARAKSERGSLAKMTAAVGRWIKPRG